MFNVPVNDSKPKEGAKQDIYIDSLPSSFTAKDFADLFAEFKTTSLNFKKHKTGSCTGFGFVSLETEEEAKRAIQELNGRQIQDQTIRAQPSAKAEQSRTNIYIEGLPQSWNDQTLRTMYEQFGEITDTKILTDRVTNLRTGVAFLHYKDSAQAKAAIDATNGTTPQGSTRALAVRFARMKNSNKSDGYKHGSGGYNNYQNNPWMNNHPGGYSGGGYGYGGGYPGGGGYNGGGYGGGYGAQYRPY